MITATASALDLRSLDRLDAWFFLAPGAAAARRLDYAKAHGLHTAPLGGPGGLGEVWQPARFKRLFASAGEKSVPYLAPYAGFQYIPEETERLAAHRIDGVERLLVQRGTILQTCSGRNLGPSFMGDAYLERFYLSDDLIRIRIDDARMRHYVYALLHSESGQGLLRRGKSGSVIDHISPEHVAAQEVPLLDVAVIDEVATLVSDAVRLVEEARLHLSDTTRAWEERLPSLDRDAPPKAGYTAWARDLTRLDAAPHDPVVRRVRAELEDMGGKPVGDYGRAIKLERYARVYVDADHGSPFLSGTQMLQYQPIKQQYMAARAVEDIDRHRVEPGWLVYQADGRAEKNLGVPALVTSDRARWVASEHVGRVVSHPGVDAGWLWLACRTQHAQLQIKALAIGSVVDTTYPPDMESVILPPDDGSVDGALATAAWEKYATARSKEREAVGLIDRALAEISGVAMTSEAAAAVTEADLTVDIGDADTIAADA